MIPYIYYGVYDAGTTPYVISDNTGSTFSGTEDTYLLEGNPTANFGSAGTLIVKAWNTNDRTHSVIKFTGLASVPSGTVSNAKLRIYCEAIADATFHPPTIHVYPLRRAFNEAQATWNLAATGTSWGTAGALNNTNDFDEIPILASAFVNTLTPPWYEFTGSDIDAYVQAIVSGGTDFGLALFESNFAAPASQFREATFTSSEGTNGQRPELTFDWASSGSPQFVSIIETSTANHSQTAVLLTSSSISESSTGSESQDAVVVKLVSITETLAAVANETAQFIASVSITETNTANHSQTVIVTFNVGANESSTASHSQTATFITSSVITETNTSTDSHDGAIVASSNVEITENSNALDSQTATQSTSATVSETSSAADTSTTLNIINVVITETSNVIDSCLVILKLVKRVITGDVSIREVSSNLIKRIFNQSLVERDVDSSLTKRDVDSNLTEREP